MVFLAPSAISEIDQLGAKMVAPETLRLFDAVSSGSLAPVSGSLRARWDVRARFRGRAHELAIVSGHASKDERLLQRRVQQ